MDQKKLRICTLFTQWWLKPFHISPSNNLMMKMMMMAMIFFFFLLRSDWPANGVNPYFLPRPLSKILIISNPRYAASRIWTSKEPDFSIYLLKLYSNDDLNITAPLIKPTISARSSPLHVASSQTRTGNFC